MKIAYLIIAHTDPHHLGRLCSSLYVKGATTFFIHIDKKVAVQPFKDAVRCICSDVVFLSNRISVNWGGWTICECEQELINECLAYKDKFDRVFMLSGLDYPIWSNTEILNFLNSNPEREFIKGMDLTTCDKPAKMQTRVKLYHYLDMPLVKNKRIKRLVYGAMREGLKWMNIVKENFIVDKYNIRRHVYCGSQWWCLTYSCLEYVNSRLKSDINMKKYLKTALAPDELMVQTIVFNSSYRKNAILHEGEYPGLVGLTPLHYIEYEGAITVWTEHDFDKLTSSGKMFCRKVQTGVSDKLMDMIDANRK